MDAMGFYNERILPHILNASCSAPPQMWFRKQLVPKARGEVLEVGMGSGLNLALYDKSQVDVVWGLEPSEGMRRKAARNLAESPVEVKWLGLRGEEVPLDDESVDTVVLTYTLCSIEGWQQALRQMRRVLKPDGKLLFCEHGLAPDTGVQRWQNRINPVWKKFAGGCNVNMPIADLIAANGFDLEESHAEYARKTPRLYGYTYIGQAGKS